ncbi:hypothetical protein [Actimicrobium sp. CCI2.3]|uniref:hypothetical protein n=1 Tax=Actimicrobium sp. CCI2.3 TaxID=3048616 RepID=UPI002AB4E604|nr:hypothetical protein [Actimicrobium sp. CCI2.3]MDY7574220.1 hypothetical protein [Actimicrobium sp. CCI2.3]MEB0022780.1 hypothetical protein [Actimicrobium sp. CCI2.3]
MSCKTASGRKALAADEAALGWLKQKVGQDMWLKNMLSHRASPDIKKARVNVRERGFVLAELAIAVVIAGMMVVSGIAYYKRQLQDDTAHALAEQYKTVNNAVGTYMVDHWVDLVNTDVSCGYSSWLVGGLPLVLPPSTLCQKTFGATSTPITIINALQPTIADLVNLGYLQQGQAGPLLQPDSTVVVTTPSGAAPHTFGIRIEVICTNTFPPTTTLTLCPDPTLRRDLRSVVFNTRPYANVDNQLYNILGEALRVLPNDAGMSIPLVTNAALDLVGRARPGALDTIVNNNFVNIPNPVRVSGATGQAGILGVRGGYGSSGFQKFTRRDGGAPPEGPWDFNSQNLKNIQEFQAQKIQLSGKKVNDTCDPTKESIAVSDISRDSRLPAAPASQKAFVICDDVGKWKLPLAKGIDPSQSMKASVTVTPGATGPFFLLNGSYDFATSGWGIPSLVGIKQGTINQNDFYQDTYCTKVSANKNNNGTLLISSDDYFSCIEYNTNAVTQTYVIPEALNFAVGEYDSKWALTRVALLPYDSNANADNRTYILEFILYKIN